jgi:NDP-sugar pyrophosphorylase family protein
MSVAKAMILAAGVGSRLGRVTEQVPKPMIEIGKKPILEHNVELLARCGIRDIVMNVHYQADVITRHFQDGSRWGVSLEYSHEEELLGTAGALLKLVERLRETFVLVYGDNIHRCDLEAALAQHRQKKALATLTIFERRNVSSSGIVSIDENDRITRILERPKEHEVFSHWVNAGLIILEPEVLGFVPAKPPSDMMRDVLPDILRAGRPVYGYRMLEGPLWVDTPQDLDWVQGQMAESERRSRAADPSFDPLMMVEPVDQ